MAWTVHTSKADTLLACRGRVLARAAHAVPALLVALTAQRAGGRSQGELRAADPVQGQGRNGRRPERSVGGFFAMEWGELPRSAIMPME